ncbi:MAG: protein translocase subunit SecD [Clostridia bacterium]|nr:protein translocase subunit SecD [Clostridia bacterium]
MKTKSWIKLGVVTVLIVLVACIALNGFQVGKYIVKPVASAISLGLDLRGGLSTEYVAVDSSVEDFDTLMDGTVSALRTRLTNAGYTEATVARQGSDKIRVEIPDVSDPQEVIDIIGKPAHLEFRDPSGNVVVEGKDIEKAYVTQDTQTQMFEVAFELNSAGTKAFAEATAANIGSAISIYLDNELVSAPTVQSAITGGSGVITTSNSTQQESYEWAKNLSMLIMSGSLPLDIEEGETRAISATLGVKAIDNALLAGMIGLAIIFVFMIIMYRLPGLMADLALCVYMLVVFYALALVPGVQLTLQGIAGILLGIGMAVDANVIIFERFREEIREGRSLDSALKMGYKNALSAVLDSNITTIIAAVALLYFGTGSIKGFATTLLISVVVSLFTAVFFTRFLMKAIIGTGIKSRAAYTR